MRRGQVWLATLDLFAALSRQALVRRSPSDRRPAWYRRQALLVFFLYARHVQRAACGVRAEGIPGLGQAPVHHALRVGSGRVGQAGQGLSGTAVAEA